MKRHIVPVGWMIVASRPMAIEDPIRIESKHPGKAHKERGHPKCDDEILGDLLHRVHTPVAHIGIGVRCARCRGFWPSVKSNVWELRVDLQAVIKLRIFAQILRKRASVLHRFCSFLSGYIRTFSQKPAACNQTLSAEKSSVEISPTCTCMNAIKTSGFYRIHLHGFCRLSR